VTGNLDWPAAGLAIGWCERSEAIQNRPRATDLDCLVALLPCANASRSSRAMTTRALSFPQHSGAQVMHQRRPSIVEGAARPSK
jgi:hypothetical protein